MTVGTPESVVLVDPRVFLPESVDEETAAYNAEIIESSKSLPPHPTDPARGRAEAHEAITYFSDLATVRSVPGPVGEVPVRVLTPETVQGVYLWYHGGGWAMGSADAADERLERVARECRVAVLSVEYRLTPEHPFPAAPDDCEAVAVWLAERAGQEFGTDRLVIGGASAGGHLAAVTLLRMRDRHGYTGFSGANLLYGVFDLSPTPSVARCGDERLVLSAPLMEWFYDQFVPPERRRDPDVSPLYADLADLPPALFTVGTRDPLLDDSMFMHARWLGAGGRSELAVYPGGAHGFTNAPLKIAAAANQRMEAFIRRSVADDA